MKFQFTCPTEKPDDCNLSRSSNLGKCNKWWSYWSPIPPLCKEEKKPFWKRKFWLLECPLPPIQPRISEACPFKPFFQVGIIWIEFLRRFWLPSSGCTMIVYAKEANETKGKKNNTNSCEPPPPPENKKLRANELPLYIEEVPCDCKTPEEKELLLVNAIKSVRLEVWKFMDQLSVLKQQTSALILEAKVQADGGIAYLREESNVVPRFGAIAIGGLGGYVLALRKGKFKRFLYTTTGAGAMAALCYPTEAKLYSSLAISNIKKYVLIGYHLFNGVSRDLTGYELPSLPGRQHLHVSDKKEDDAVPPPEHLLPPLAVPTHIHVHPGKKPVVD